jgi:serine/threonine-protein kinase
LGGSDDLIGLAGTRYGGRYAVLEKLGAGSVSQVYRARDLSQVRTVALKVLDSGKQEISPARAKMFEHDAKLNLLHPHLVALHACGFDDDNHPWLAFEFIEGETLAQVLQREGYLPVSRVVAIFRQIIDALAYLHNRGEIYMNLKPSSVFLMQQEGKPFVKLADAGFGQMLLEIELSRLNEKERPTGSPLYMSPEQLKGEPIDARSDVYSAGCLMYHCLVGRPPHEGIDVLETMDMHLRAAVKFPSDPEISDALQAVITKALEKNADRRQRNAAELLSDIDNALKGKQPERVQIYVAPTSNSYRPPVGRRPPRKKGHEPWTLLLNSVTVLLLIIIIQQCLSMVSEIDKRYPGLQQAPR